MKDLSKYRSIQEIATGTDFNESRAVVREINSYLNIGWQLISVHERGWRDETERYTTVYILGHTHINAVVPGDIPF